MLMTNSEHAALHHREDKNVIKEYRACTKCKVSFEVTNKSEQKYCSPKCASDDRVKFQITKEELSDIVWKMPMTKIASIYNVSDVTVKKWCQHFDIEVPKRGYFLKK
jgi:transposase-like protein